jgi:hypothetical protein
VLYNWTDQQNVTADAGDGEEAVLDERTRSYSKAIIDALQQDSPGKRLREDGSDSESQHPSKQAKLGP